MEIEIKNFGPISYLKFDLKKDIHLIYGKNAIGKSYATYLIYCLLKTLKSQGHQPRTYSIETEVDQSIEEYLKGLVDSSQGQVEVIDITNFVCKLIENRLENSFLPAFKNTLQNTFGSLRNLQNQFSKRGFQICFSGLPGQHAIVTLEDEEQLSIAIDLGGEKIALHKKNTESTGYQLICMKILHGEFFNSIEGALEIQEVVDFVSFNLFCLPGNAPVADIYYLPASRSGLYQALSAFAPIIAELTQNRFFLESKKIELPGLSEPVSDYFIDLSTVDHKHDNLEFKTAIQFLEEKIVQGEVHYDEQSKKIIFTPNGTGLQLNLSEASSMVSELSPLVIFLKHIISNKFNGTLRKKSSNRAETSVLHVMQGSDILFIEEPEAHLHPEVQVLLVELFAMLSKQGIKIFMNSHSNYMFNKLNNMLIGGELDENKVEAYHLVASPEGTVRNPNMHATSEGIDDENFQETSQKLYLERMALLEAQNDR